MLYLWGYHNGSRVWFFSIYTRFTYYHVYGSNVGGSCMNECLTDKKGNKWAIDGYYIDNKGTAWTLLVCVGDWGKRKKIKGVI